MSRTAKLFAFPLALTIALSFTPSSALAAPPEWVRHLIACLCCALGPGDPYCCSICSNGPDGLINAGDTAIQSASAWISNVNDCLTENGAGDMAACRSTYMLATAPGHSWSLAWNPGTQILTINNTGSVRDTACVMVAGIKGYTMELDPTDAVVGVNSGASVNVDLSGTLAGRNGRHFAVVSATGTGLNGDGFAHVTTPNATPGVSTVGMSLLALALGAITSWWIWRTRRRATGAGIA